jgi:hypothetical protein
MKRLLLPLLLMLVAALASTAPAAHSGRATIRLVRGDTLAVRGSGFYAHERVRVTVAVNWEKTKTVRTGSAGTFSADFGSTFVDPCSRVVVRAVGAKGDRALLKIPPRECSPG